MNMSYLITLVGLFVILSPGLLLTLPGLSQKEINSKGISSGAAGSATVCPATTSLTGLTNCLEATAWWASMETSYMAVGIHAVVFYLAVYTAQMQFPQNGTYSATSMMLLAGLFAVLSPGVLLTLPALSLDDCGLNNHNVADGARYCDSTYWDTNALQANCKKCSGIVNSGFTSPVSIVVHSAVFGAVVYFLGSQYLS